MKPVCVGDKTGSVGTEVGTEVGEGLAESGEGVWTILRA